ncbi:MAG: FAD-binding protein [Paracoccaceae bacterium]
MRPESEAELAETIASATGPFAVQGGGTRPVGKPVAGEVLSVSAMSGIELYEPGALTIVAKAGTPLAEVEAALAAEGQRLAFEPMDHRGLLGTTGDPTIGGVVAANVSGPRRIQVGAARDHLLGVRFVDGSGTVIKNGGRVMKNVTGYDLVKLLAGSHGTLGVLTEVALKVLPKTDVTASVMIHGLSDRAAVAAMSKALGSPFEVTGAAHIAEAAGGQSVTFIRIEGFEASVAYRLAQLTDLLAGQGEIVTLTDPDKVVGQWRDIRDVKSHQGSGDDIWRLSVKPSDAPGIVARMPEGTRVSYDWGGGLIWAATAPGTDLRAAINPFSGHATLIRASEATRAALPVFQPDPAPLATITAGLRQKFDPRGILNPGLMG